MIEKIANCPYLQTYAGKSCKQRSRKRSFSATRRLKHGSAQQWLKKGSKGPQGENGQSLKWMKRKYDAAVHGYTFLFLTPFSFVKLFKKMIDEL